MHRNRTVIGALSLIVLLLLLAFPAQRPQPAAAQSNTPIPCSSSPFGAVIDLGREQELFLGFTVADTGQVGNLGAYRFDHNPDLDVIQEQNLAISAANQKATVSGRVGAAADLNGDGRSEFVQVFSDAGGRYQLATYGQNEAFSDYIDDGGNHSNYAIAGGDLLGLEDGREQVVVASRSPSGALSVQIFQGNDSGVIASKAALWRSTTNNRAQPSQISVVVGNLDNDGYLDIVVAFRQSSGNANQMVYLEYAPGEQTGSGDNIAQNLVVRAFGSESSALPRSQRLEMADLSGDSLDEIILAYESVDGSPTMLAVFSYDLVAAALDRRVGQLFSTGQLGFAIATGDIDGISNNIRQEEIVLAFESQGAFGFGSGLHLQAIRLTNLDTPSPQLTSIAYRGDTGPERNNVSNIDLVIADVDKDNRGEIYAAFSDGNPFGFQMAAFRFQAPQTIQFVSAGRFDATLTTPPDLVAADWNNDSLRGKAEDGKAESRCEQIVEYQVSSAVFVPPFWQNMQGELEKEATIGQSLANENAIEKSYTYSHGHAASAYVGAGVGISLFDIVELGAAVKATASYEYSTSNRRATSTTSSEVRTFGRSFSDDGVAYQPSSYKCYSYQLYENGIAVPLDDAGVRLCEYVPLDDGEQALPLAGSGLDGWDSNRSGETEYVPIARDWANLSLFRGAHTAQSSGSSAALAVDSEVLNGSFVGATVAETNVQAQPWWQIDLGSVQPISKVRIWTPPASLADFVLLVSDSDFRQIAGHENPANLIGRSDVRVYTPADLGLSADAAVGEATTLLTPNASGRFVRIQRNDSAALRLAEVQIFGLNHEDPDRYPLNVRDTNSEDGFFEAQLYNPNQADPQLQFPWVKMRGRLIWGGNLGSGIPTLLVSRGGNSSAFWSLSSSSGASQLEAEGFSSSSSVGVEFEVEGGVVVKVQAGGAASETYGVSEETVLSSSWSSGFDLGGSVPNLPSAYNGAGQSWAERCQYGTKPYFYELSDQSSFGYEQRYTVLDYTVSNGENNSLLLDRREDLSACRNGNLTSETPQAAPDTQSMTVGGTQSFFVLANDQGNNLRITAVGPAANGTVAFSDRSLSYTPNSGFTGEDSFSYTVSDGNGVETTASVTVTVEPNKLYLPLLRR